MLHEVACALLIHGSLHLVTGVVEVASSEALDLISLPLNYLLCIYGHDLLRLLPLQHFFGDLGNLVIITIT